MEKKARNYYEEYKRKKELNRIYHLAINKDIANMLDKKLKQENKNITKWFLENVENYLKK